jgi:TRAP-type C4-dicarboxylate transport system substrate-binding protein
MTWQPNVTAQGETAAALFQSVEQGQRHLAYMASGYLSLRVPELRVIDLPFAHTQRQNLMGALDGAAGQILCEAIERQSAFRCLGFWDNGQRHISNALRPLRSPDDVQGMALRTLDSALYRDSLRAMGFDARTCDVKGVSGHRAGTRESAHQLTGL